MKLNEYLNNSVKKNERVDESLILGAIVAATCVAYAAKPMLETDFMKSVGSGIGGLLSGLGGMFGGMIGKVGGLGGSNVEDIQAILKKNPGDMTGKEKELLQKVKNNPKLQKNFSDNDLKKLNGVLDGTVKDEDEKGKEKEKEKETKEEGISADDNKKLQALLKKNPEDLSPRERRELQALNSKYDLQDELSPKDFEKFKNMGVDKKDDETPESTPEEQSAALMALAAKANEGEKDPEKKAKTQAMLDIMTASSYDENGEPIPMQDRMSKMKEMVGESNWDSFTADIDEMQKNTNTDEFKKALEDAKKNLKPEDIKSMVENQKKNAKEAAERITKENKEREDLEKEMEELKKDPEANKDKIKELQTKREELINKSTLGKASPNTAKAAIESAKKKDDDKPETEPKEKEPEKETEPKEKEPEKEKTVDDVKAEYKEKQKELQDKYDKMIDDAKDDDEAEKAMAEYEKEKKKLNAEQHKEMDAIDDNDEHTDDDDSKKGKYVVKDEEVTDPKTGGKIKVKTYTGPRGGKFYYPKGAPKKPENKVYVHESETNIKQHLFGRTISLKGFLKSLF